MDDTSHGLRHILLNVDNVHMRDYTDAPLTTNDDLTSQLGYVARWCDHTNRRHVLDFASKMSSRIFHFTKEGELYAFMVAFYISLTLLMDVRTLLSRKLMLHMFTNRKQVFDVVTRGRCPTKRRLAINVSATRDAYIRREIDRVGSLQGRDYPADAVSKIERTRCWIYF